MSRPAHRIWLAWLLAVVTGCASGGREVSVEQIYAEPARHIGSARNPVIVIPGILGSNLVQRETRQVVWGAFVYGAADADYPEGARLFALPMGLGKPLAELRDDVDPDGVLESLEANVALFRVTALEPYRGIIRTLAAGRYVDRDIARAASGSNDAGDAGVHSTCFQFDYDWRRDISENAARLHELIRSASELAQEARGTAEPVKVDVVAHSMGGLVLRYYLQYGTQPLPEDGSVPVLTWAGAEHVERAILVGTPNAGSVLSLKQLIEGVSYAPIVPEYRPAVIGTMPAIYQLLPRDRHHRVVDGQGMPVGSLYDVATWQRHGWGLADPSQEQFLAWLLPDVADASERRHIAIDHLRKCLNRAEQLHRALDAPVAPPPHVRMSIVLGDSERTPSALTIGDGQKVRITEWAPGDGTVTRTSALMDERVGGPYAARLRSPIKWSRVQLLAADHIELTEHPAFVDGLLYELLEDPR